jgi:hypothetical protein
LQASLDARRAGLLAIVRRKKQTPIQAEILRLKAALAVAALRQEQLEKDFDAKQKDARKAGSSFVDIEMARAELKHLEALLARLAMEKDAREAELRWPPRVTLLQGPTAPEDAVPGMP